LTIELVFHLFRNLLAAEPLLNSKCSSALGLEDVSVLLQEI
jgi:hypothetical protein